MAKKRQITPDSIKKSAQATKTAKKQAAEEAARLAQTPDDKRALEAELRAYIKKDGTGFIKDLSDEKKVRAKDVMKQLGRTKMEYDMNILDEHFQQVGD